MEITNHVMLHNWQCYETECFSYLRRCEKELSFRYDAQLAEVVLYRC